MERSLASTAGSHGLCGGPGTVARQLGELHEAGLDGLCLTWMNYEQGLRDFTSEVLPLLEKDGVRRAPAATGPPAQP